MWFIHGGRTCFKTAIQNNKRAQAFGGAKIIASLWPDANMKQAAKPLPRGLLWFCGERCMALSIVLAVGDTVADQLIPLIKERIARFKVGPGTEADVELGPLTPSSIWIR